MARDRANDSKATRRHATPMPKKKTTLTGPVSPSTKPYVMSAVSPVRGATWTQTSLSHDPHQCPFSRTQLRFLRSVFSSGGRDKLNHKLTKSAFSRKWTAGNFHQGTHGQDAATAWKFMQICLRNNRFPSSPHDNSVLHGKMQHTSEVLRLVNNVAEEKYTTYAGIDQWSVSTLFLCNRGPDGSNETKTDAPMRELCEALSDKIFPQAYAQALQYVEASGDADHLRAFLDKYGQGQLPSLAFVNHYKKGKQHSGIDRHVDDVAFCTVCVGLHENDADGRACPLRVHLDDTTGLNLVMPSGTCHTIGPVDHWLDMARRVDDRYTLLIFYA